MGRILKAYRTRFHQMLRQTGARRIEQGVDWLVTKAQGVSIRRGVSLANGLTLTYEELASKPVFARVAQKPRRTPQDITFFCDAGLGGLARWLRGAGYVALWDAGIADDQLLAKARQQNAAILTTDSMLMERRVLRDGVISSFWLPPTLSIADQLERVFQEFRLCIGSPRCMSCGGELVRGDKESLRERIPPKTFRWLDEYFLCARCGKLFWHGTHWHIIMQRLRALGRNSQPVVPRQRKVA
jgi:uncharacterized protein with PIN domain